LSETSQPEYLFDRTQNAATYWVLELLSSVVAGELRVLVDVVGEGVVLFVHDLLVRA